MWGHTRSIRRLPQQRRRPAKRRIWLQFILFLSLSLIAVGSTFGWQSVHAADVAPAQAEAGELLFKDAAGYERAVLLGSNADFKISGMIARVNVRQEFRNTGSDWREAVYVFPLPEQAAVRSMRMHIGERLIEGEIKERTAAKKIYQTAKADGKQTALVEQERPNMFTTSVANIGPGETVTVELEYVEQITYDSGEFSLRFPMTVTPRYIPGQPLTADNAEVSLTVAGDGWAYNTDQVTDAARITPHQNPVAADESTLINPVTITAEINAGLPLAGIESPRHDIRIDENEKRYKINLANGPVSMSRDFELRWRPQSGHEPKAALFTEILDDEHYALLMLLPPDAVSTEQILPREMIYVIDTSGSMGGVSIRQARESLLLALDKLRAGDHFNVIEFNSVSNALFTESRPVTAERLQQAKRFVAGLQARGGTEMRSALEMALGTEAREDYMRQVLFMTDGAVGNEAALFQIIQDRLGKARLFTVGIGSAPNSYFMRKAAQFGRGTFTTIGSVNEVGSRMSELFRKIDAPIAGDLNVQWPDGIQSETYPSPLPDLYQGEALLLAARLGDFGGDVTVSGRLAGQVWQRQLGLTGQNDSPGVASVWARRKIVALLDARIAGGDEESVRSEVLEVALKHQLASPYTSFVAVEKTPSRAADEALTKEGILNARPDGQSPQPYAWPATATSSRVNIMAGGFLLLLALMLWLMQTDGLRRARS